MKLSLEKHINNDFPFIKGKKLLVAISGGIDSVVLAHLLHGLGYEIFLAHCNFKLRGEASNLDEDFVKELGKELNVITFVKKFDTKEYAEKQKLSIQLAARELRYQWFSEIRKEHQLGYLVTGHHADDNLETFLINMSRGTGLEGLTGIPKQNKEIIRPLLPFSREEILAYAKNNQIAWREDASNSEIKYIRNRIRHQVIPVLKEINPNLLNSFSRTIAHLEESSAIIAEKVKEITPQILLKVGDEVRIDIEKVLKLSSPKAYLYALLKTYNFTEWDNVFDLLTAQSGKQIRSKTHVLLKDRAFLILKSRHEIAKGKQKFIIEKGITTVDEPIRLHIEIMDKKQSESKNYALVNKNLVTFPMILRKREDGDFFYPTGMFGKKKVSKFFKDEKLSQFQKDETWLLCNANNEIIWIVGMRQDRRFLPTSTTENFLKISI
ncbi:tRNA lysidine(34) synthetase TilS [Tenacibaculum amylolyticum]|uniref:tRNA lysidine(34) synthetase TilS n=1 Tax=Tenacibaculum amylolyticum TaxID=104269 RepID=UPI0038946965